MLKNPEAGADGAGAPPKAREPNQPLQDERPNSKSMVATLERWLHDAIDSGELAVGTPLPSERELMTRFKISRTTVREALRMLSAQGLIQVRRGRTGGSFISSPTPYSVARSLTHFIKGQDIRYVDMVFAREAIEPAAAAQAALSRTEEKLEALRACCVECEESVGEAEKFVPANLRWHLALAEASGNPLFVAFLTSMHNALHSATDLDAFDLRIRKLVVGVHWQIYEAIHAGDPEAARRRMIRHLSAYSHTLATTLSDRSG